MLDNVWMNPSKTSLVEIESGKCNDMDENGFCETTNDQTNIEIWLQKVQGFKYSQATIVLTFSILHILRYHSKRCYLFAMYKRLVSS
jgi:hypothetical protein